MTQFIKAVFLWLGFFISWGVSAQTVDQRLCGQEAIKAKLAAEGKLDMVARNQVAFNDFLHTFQLGERTQNVLRIPVVVHVMHAPGEAYGFQSNITDEQILSQIEVLNEDFRKQLGSRGFNNNPVGADSEIEFCLATRDPSGNLSNGIVRVAYSGSTNFQLAQDRNMKDLSRWPTTRYLNIWIVKSIQSGILGYAYLPETLNGDPDRARIDGLVIGARFFGSRDKQPINQNFFLDNTFAYGRTATHEIGHYLNLLHTWGDGGCEVDDLVDDTPLCSGQYFGCPPNPARPNQCGFNRMVENYMDYSDDVCFNIFTQGQKTRMNAALQFYNFRSSLVSPLNLVATGCTDSSNSLYADTLFMVVGDTQVQRVNKVYETDLTVRILNQLGSGFNNEDVRFQLVNQPAGANLQLDTIISTKAGGYAQWAFTAGGIPGAYVVRATANTARGGVVEFRLNAISEALAYPNPFSDIITLKLDYPAETPVDVRIYDLAGRMVDEQSMRAKEALVLELSALPDNFYLVTATTSSMSDYFKIVKIRR